MRLSSSVRNLRLAQQRKYLASKNASERISTALRAGMIPWKNGLRDDANAGLPLNVATGMPFTPISTLLLQVASQQHDFIGRWWGTQQHWTRLRGNIDPSCEPTIVFHEEWLSVEVYCVDQVTGSNVDRFQVCDHSVIANDNADFGQIERLVKATGADIRIGVGDKCHPPSFDGYVPPNPWISFPSHAEGDYVLLRSPERRSRTTHYYTLLHELIHWAEVRTNWIDDMPARELVAEIGSGWLAMELGCPPCWCPINHNNWLERWLFEMDADYFFRAADQARAASQFILSFVEDDRQC